MGFGGWWFRIRGLGLLNACFRDRYGQYGRMQFRLWRFSYDVFLVKGVKPRIGSLRAGGTEYVAPAQETAEILHTLTPDPSSPLPYIRTLSPKPETPAS